jgi:hypothetical protein
MARLVVPVSNVSHYAATPKTASSFTTVINGFVVPNDGATWLSLDNSTNASPCTVTVQVAQGFDVNLTVNPRTYTLSANTSGFTGLFPLKTYGAQLLVNITTVGFGMAAYSLAAVVTQDF